MQQYKSSDAVSQISPVHSQAKDHSGRSQQYVHITLLKFTCLVWSPEASHQMQDVANTRLSTLTHLSPTRVPEEGAAPSALLFLLSDAAAMDAVLRPCGQAPQCCLLLESRCKSSFLSERFGKGLNLYGEDERDPALLSRKAVSVTALLITKMALGALAGCVSSSLQDDSVQVKQINKRWNQPKA